MAKDTGVFSMPQPNGAFTTYGVKVYDSYAEMRADTPPHIQLGLIKGENTVYRFENGVWVIGFPQINDSRDYTAFEVYAHDTDIPAGVLTEPHSKFIGKPGDELARKVTASMEESFSLRTLTPPEKQDVVVDWGDGTLTELSTITPVISGTEYRYTVNHVYTTPGTYIVKIFGRSYFAFMTSGTPETTLISRIFEEDLPVASWLWNFSSVCLHAQRLLHVNVYNHLVARSGLHWSRAFTSALNLIDVSGFTAYNTSRNSNYNCFQNCVNLSYSDFRMAAAPPDVNGGNGYAYAKCYKLAVDVEDLLPAQGFKAGSVINMAEAFRAGYLLTMASPESVANKLWLNTSVTFTNTAKTFEMCSAELRAHVPVSWGGTMEESSTEA